MYANPCVRGGVSSLCSTSKFQLNHLPGRGKQSVRIATSQQRIGDIVGVVHEVTPYTNRPRKWNLLATGAETAARGTQRVGGCGSGSQAQLNAWV